MDLRAVLLAPSLSTSASYYQTKLACHNFFQDDSGTSDVDTYFWHEAVHVLLWTSQRYCNSGSELWRDYQPSIQKWEARNTDIKFRWLFQPDLAPTWDFFWGWLGGLWVNFLLTFRWLSTQTDTRNWDYSLHFSTSSIGSLSCPWP